MMTRATHLQPVAVTRGPRHHFFGYYDKSPWDASGRWLLGMETSFMDRAPEPDDVATIGVIDTAAHYAWTPLATTRAWNWQQGCMLQWLGATRQFIFNDRCGDRFISRCYDLDRGETARWERPVYAVHPEGSIALSVNFSRLHHQRPGYGYPGIADPWAEIGAPEEDGVHRLDLATGASSLVLSLADAARFQPDAAFKGKTHRFNHLQFSREGDRVALLHRYRKEGPHLTRLLVMTPEGGELRCLSDHEMVSHYDWGRGGVLIAWARRHGWGDRYYLFHNDTITTLESRQLNQDGHCSFSPDGRRILTDTYPDAAGNQTLLLHDIASARTAEVLTLRSMQLPNIIRCDLHPRWNRSGDKICFDSTHEGSRQIYTLDLNDFNSHNRHNGHHGLNHLFACTAIS